MYNLSMTIHNLITLDGETATLLSPPNTHSGTDITIQNVNASGYIYIGSDSVNSDSYGYRILPNHAISFELDGRDSLYAMSSAPDMDVAVIMVSLESGE